jgi:nitrate reductase gamma subunit
MWDNFLFIGLPYAVIVIVLVGTIFRYRAFGFKVSSLSSQFLESRELFLGIRPFHWGIITLFFGHLIGFLFPKSVMLFGRVPWRLFIIESAALGFGFLTLYGLLMLIIRRAKHNRLMAVTSRMDILVYVILAVQVISGIWIALTARWGSVWFAATLVPYIKSVFLLSPDIAAISAMPLSVKIHTVSAFVLIGIIPFTRFMHFLVYPFTYIGRPYQIVIWNWNRKKIRNSENLINGVRSRNN